jgi:hypothetical protein
VAEVVKTLTKTEMIDIEVLVAEKDTHSLHTDEM